MEHYKICYGSKGKKYYIISEKFWKWISEKKVNCKNYGSKTELINSILKLTKNNIPKLTVINWIYGYRKPIIVNNIIRHSKNGRGCVHGLKYFCPVCEINNQYIDNCPVPALFKTHTKGKIYIHEDFWNEFIFVCKNCNRYGILPSKIAEILNIDSRGLRKWRNRDVKPQIYSKDEFILSPQNSYWLGIHLSDGHIRNNGSKLSFTWQVGSSNPFQGYWFPQFIQNHLKIFSHKKNRSLTYLQYSKDTRSWFFKTNVSALSPIFAKFLESLNIIKRIKNIPTSGYSKNLPKDYVKNLKSKDILFQGIMDGDGSYNISEKHGININLSLHPNANYKFIEEMPLVPTAGKDINENYDSYEKLRKAPLGEIRFAPSSLRSLSKKYSVANIIDQFEFMLKAAENSIRPDKVHTLIKIIKRVSSKEYGEYRSCLEIQKKIRDECEKRNLVKFTKSLEKRFPISDGFYKPFMPKWTEAFASKRAWKQEFWDFFSDGKFLVNKNYPKSELLDFSNGVPIDFDMTMSVRT